MAVGLCVRLMKPSSVIDPSDDQCLGSFDDTIFTAKLLLLT